MLFVMDAYRVNITGMESRRPPRRIGTHHLADAGSAEPPPSRGQWRSAAARRPRTSRRTTGWTVPPARTGPASSPQQADP